MSVYDSIYLGSTIRIDPEFSFESVTLRVWYKKPGAAWEEAWDPNGGRAYPTIPLRSWEELQRWVKEDAR